MKIMKFIAGALSLFLGIMVLSSCSDDSKDEPSPDLKPEINIENLSTLKVGIPVSVLKDNQESTPEAESLYVEISNPDILRYDADTYLLTGIALGTSNVSFYSDFTKKVLLKTINITVAPTVTAKELAGTALDLKSLIPVYIDDSDNNFDSENPQVALFYRSQYGSYKIECQKPGSTYVKNDKYIIEVTVEPYEGKDPLVLPAGLNYLMSETDALEVMSKYGTPTAGTDFFYYTYCDTYTYTSYPEMESIKLYFNMNDAEGSRELLYVNVVPKQTPKNVLAFLLTNYELDEVSSNGAQDFQYGKRYFRSPKGWYVRGIGTPLYSTVLFCSPGYEIVPT